MKRFLLTVICISLLSGLPLFAADTATSYDDINFPQWAKDLRRTEIITFGSLPFVTIWATVGYSAAKYGEFRNPLNKSSDGFSTSDQKHIMQIAAISCVSLGLTDLAITLVRRSAKKRRELRSRRPDVIVIEPLKGGEGEKAGRDEEKAASPEVEQEKPLPGFEYLQGGIKRAVF